MGTEQTVSFFKESLWCISCCCFGHGLTSKMSPCCWSLNKCFCCHSKCTSSEDVCGPMGFLSGLNKFFCYVSHSQIPPKPVTCAVCNFFVVGQPPTAPPVMTSSQASQISYLENVLGVLLLLLRCRLHQQLCQSLHLGAEQVLLHHG